MRAPQFLRQTVRWDFAPDICKDYKETGFCTFGGNITDDTLQSFEIHNDGDEIPEICYTCGNEFTDPVITRCGHYFCELCALNQFKKSKKCPICNEPTGGVFNRARGKAVQGSSTAHESPTDHESPDESPDE
uniref:RING-type domain-containing protein n=1 Tax=Heterorhabditis bacteriophora TaxID=37862 RepID=A0A1I7XSW5_HETBA